MCLYLILDLFPNPCLDGGRNGEILGRERKDSSEDIDDFLSKRMHFG